MAYVTDVLHYIIIVILSLSLIGVDSDYRLKYVKMVDTYIEHGFMFLSTESAMRCCLGCKLEARCASISYQTQNNTCQLNTRNPTDWPNIRITGTTDWISYKIDIVPCMSPWTLYNRHCYLVVNESVIWTDADANCRSLDSHLVAINDEAEHNFLYNFVAQSMTQNYDFWIGLNNEAVDQPYVFTNGEPVSYTRYDVDEPSNTTTSGKPEHCFEVRKGGFWNDCLCNKEKIGVCEKVHY